MEGPHVVSMAVVSIVSVVSTPCCPHGPHVVPVVPTSSPLFLCHPCHPHVIPIAPRRSPCGLHGCRLRCLCGLHSMLSPWSPRRPCCPHVVPISSPSSQHRLEGPHIIPNHPDTHSTHPLSPGGGGGPQISKNAIRFELIEIF